MPLPMALPMAPGVSSVKATVVAGGETGDTGSRVRRLAKGWRSCFQ